jgi:uroporphyrinogen-III synthase
MRFIVTRPEPDATRTAQALIRLGHEAILSPMLDIRFLGNARIPERAFQAVLVTSSNAVRAMQARRDRPFPAGTPLFAVGDQTALEAKRAGFSGARSAGGALDDLVRKAAAELSPADGPLLYAAGEDRAGDLAEQLIARGFEVEMAVVYQAEARDRMASVAESGLRDGNAHGVLFHSRRTAEVFGQALKAAGLAPLSAGVTCFCLSPNMAEPLATMTQGRVLVAARPDQISLFALLEQEAAATRPTH